jgi:hypothetical protein
MLAFFGSAIWNACMLYQTRSFAIEALEWRLEVVTFMAVERAVLAGPAAMLFSTNGAIMFKIRRYVQKHGQTKTQAAVKGLSRYACPFLLTTGAATACCLTCVIVMGALPC